MFLLSFLLAVAFAAAVTIRLGFKNPHQFILAAIIFFAADILIAFYITGFSGQLNQTWLFILVQVILLGISIALVWKDLRHWRSHLPRLQFSKTGLVEFVRKNPLLSIFSLIVDLCYAVNAYLIVVVPPNNNDALYIHMAKVGHWLRQGSLQSYSTYYLYQLFYPYNAQALIYWTVLFSGSDKFAGFIQYFSAFFCVLSIYGIARLLNLSAEQGFFASFIFLTFPQVFFQSTTTQNDLITAAFILQALYFLLYGLQKKELRFLVVSGIAFGMALGIKQTAFFILPVILLVLIWVYLKRQNSFKQITVWIISFAIAAVLLGSASYLKNLVSYHNPIGPSEATTGFVGLQDDTPMPRALALNTTRLLYQFVDTTGLPPILEGYLFRGKARLASRLFDAIGFPLDSTDAWYADSQIRFDYYLRPELQEDGTWFGLVCALLLTPLFILSIFWAIKKKQPVFFIFPLSVVIFHLGEFLVRPGWDFYVGRNYLVPVAIMSPLIGFAYKPALRSRLFTATLMLLSGYMVVNMVFNNQSKPLVGRDAIWILDRSQKITLQARMLRTPLDFVERKVPDGATIGLSPNTMEYPYFGEYFTRNLTAVKPVEKLADRDWLRRNGIDYLLVNYGAIPQGIEIPFAPILSDKEWGLYKVE